MKRKTQIEYGYGIYMPSGKVLRLFAPSIRDSHTDCVNAFEKTCKRLEWIYTTWKELYKAGYRCKAVTILTSED